MNQYLKYWFTYLFISFFALIWFCFWYEWQWFLLYQETEEWITFICEKKCIIELWQKEKFDFLQLNWEIDGIGVMQFIKNDWKKNQILKYHRTIYDKLYFINYEERLNKVSKDDNISIKITWNIKWFLKIDKIHISFLQKLKKRTTIAREDFLKKDYPDQVSIMRRTGVVINWISILIYGYSLFLLISIIILLLKKKKEIKRKILFYVWLWLFLFIWIRNTVTYTYITNSWVALFKTNQTYLDLWDFIFFMDKVRKKLDLDSKKFADTNCVISTNSTIGIDNWIFKGRLDYYLKPCKLVIVRWDRGVDYKIYYKKMILSEDLDKKILVEYNDSYLLDNKETK